MGLKNNSDFGDSTNNTRQGDTTYQVHHLAHDQNSRALQRWRPPPAVLLLCSPFPWFFVSMNMTTRPCGTFLSSTKHTRGASTPDAAAGQYSNTRGISRDKLNTCDSCYEIVRGLDVDHLCANGRTQSGFGVPRCSSTAGEQANHQHQPINLTNDTGRACVVAGGPIEQMRALLGVTLRYLRAAGSRRGARGYLVWPSPSRDICTTSPPLQARTLYQN